jgi:hypothetical protein
VSVSPALILCSCSSPRLLPHLHGRPDRRPHRPQARDLDFHPGAAPFTLALPYVNLFWTAVLTVVIGFVISSAFSAIVVFAQELVPGKVGMIAGIFFGLMFGVSGIGAAAMGHIADVNGIAYVYQVCAPTAACWAS